ncbi:hypothetical protein LTS12_029447, partial [Elasticomyces elasticus]
DSGGHNKLYLIVSDVYDGVGMKQYGLLYSKSEKNGVTKGVLCTVKEYAFSNMALLHTSDDDLDAISVNYNVH